MENRRATEVELLYGMLGYSFAVSSSQRKITDDIQYVLGDFTISRAARRAPVHVYRFVELGSRRDQRHRLSLDGVEVTTASSLREVFYAFLNHVHSMMFERTRDLLLVHAGCVSQGDVAVLLPADPGSGKTTLVASLVRAGFGYLSDEIAPVDPQSGLVHPFPRALIVRKSSLRLFGDVPASTGLSPVTYKNRRFISAQDLGAETVRGPRLPGLVVVPRFEPGAETSLTPLRPAETAIELWQHVMNLRNLAAAPALDAIRRVAVRVRGYRLVTGDLNEGIATVRRLLGKGGLQNP